MRPPTRDMEQSNAVGAGLGRLILADWFAVARADTALAAGHRRSPDPRTASGGHYLPAAHAQLVPGRLCRDRQDTAAALGHAQKAAHQFAASQLDDELRQTRRLIAEIADQSSQYGRALSS